MPINIGYINIATLFFSAFALRAGLFGGLARTRSDGLLAGIEAWQDQRRTCLLLQTDGKGSAMTVLTIGFVILIVLVIWWGTGIGSNDTLDGYRQRYPHLVSDGVVKCASCGGTSLWMKRIMKSPFGSVYSHTCRTCGSSLYKSRGL